MKFLNIHVTEDDITNGKKFVLRECPLALALERTVAFGYDFKVGVRSLTVGHGSGDEGLVLHMPAPMIGFREDFDDGGKVHEARFQLQIPAEGERFFKPEALTASLPQPI
jgi:hypothetical protein